MELTNIEILIKKYEDAQTSLQEEQVLKEYFTGKNVVPHLQEYTHIFIYLKQQKEVVYTRNINVTSSKKKNYSWLYVAATVVVLLSVFVGKNKYDDYQQRQEANRIFTEVTKSLKLLSINIKKGENAIATLSTYESSVAKILK
jgi:hypothetical protein